MAKIVLGVAAHPDDLDFMAGGTFAKWARDGYSCYYLICTDGCRGSSGQKMKESKLRKIRAREQREAASILGVKEVYFLKHKDTELEPDLRLKKEIVRYIRELEPEIVLTSDPTFVYSKNGYINHLDHRAAGLATIDAVYPLARDRLAFKDLALKGLKPHKTKYLYMANPDTGDFIIDITGTMEYKLRALACHESQVDETVLERTKERAGRIGEMAGYKYGESFVILELY